MSELKKYYFWWPKKDRDALMNALDWKASSGGMQNRMVSHILNYCDPPWRDKGEGFEELRDSNQFEFDEDEQAYLVGITGKAAGEIFAYLWEDQWVADKVRDFFWPYMREYVDAPPNSNQKPRKKQYERGGLVDREARSNPVRDI